MKPIPIPNRQSNDLGVSFLPPVNVFKGLTTLDPYAAGPGFATRSNNLTMEQYPMIVTRTGINHLNTADTADTSEILGLGVHAGSEIIMVKNGHIYKVNETTGALTLITGSVNGGAINAYPCVMCDFKGNQSAINTYIVNGLDNVRYDGTSIFVIGVGTGVGQFPAYFTTIAQHNDRMYGTKGSTLYFSNLRKPLEWSTFEDNASGGTIEIESLTKEDITCLLAGPDHLMIFQQHTFYELYGTNPANYTLKKIADVGAVGHYAAAMKDGTAYFISTDGLYSYTGGMPRKEFSNPVAGLVKQMALNSSFNAIVTVTDRSVQFTFEKWETTAGGASKRMTLEYFPEFGTWSAVTWDDDSWYRPKATLWWKNQLYAGMDYGELFRVEGTTYTDVPDGVNQIQFEWVSTPFGSGRLSDNHRWYKLWLVFDIDAGATLNVSISPSPEGDTDWQVIQTFTGALSITPHRVQLPLASVANSPWLRVKFNGSGHIRIMEINVQQRTMPLM